MSKNTKTKNYYLIAGLVIFVVIASALATVFLNYRSSEKSDSGSSSSSASQIRSSQGAKATGASEFAMYPDLSIPSNIDWKADTSKLQPVDSYDKYIDIQEPRLINFRHTNGSQVELLFYGSIGGGVSDKCFVSDKVVRTGGRFTRTLSSSNQQKQAFYYIENSYVALKGDADFELKKSEVIQLLERAYGGQEMNQAIIDSKNSNNNVCIQNVLNENVLFTQTSFKDRSGKEDYSAPFSILIPEPQKLSVEQLKTAESFINTIKF